MFWVKSYHKHLVGVDSSYIYKISVKIFSNKGVWNIKSKTHKAVVTDSKFKLKSLWVTCEQYHCSNKYSKFNRVWHQWYTINMCVFTGNKVTEGLMVLEVSFGNCRQSRYTSCKIKENQINND